MNRAFLTRYAWVSIIAALVTLGLKMLAWHVHRVGGFAV